MLSFDEVVLDAQGRQIAHPAAVAMVDAASSSRPLGSDSALRIFQSKESADFYKRFPAAHKIGVR